MTGSTRLRDATRLGGQTVAMTESSDTTESTPVPNVGPRAKSGIDHEPLTAREPSTLAGHPAYREQREGDAPDGYLDPADEPKGAGDAGGDSDDGSDDDMLRGEALDAALEERGLSKSGTADEKRARVAEHDAAQ